MATQNRTAPELFFKAPSGDRDYSFDFSLYQEIATGGLTITGTPVVTATPATGSSTLTVGTPSVNAAGDTVTVELSGGTAGVLYGVLCLATLSNGRVLDQYGRLAVDGPPAA